MDIVEFLKDKTLNDIAPQALSNRELETLRAISRGYDVAQIAKLLKISRNTVKVYMANLSQKIGIPTSKTNFRVALCIFYNTYKSELYTGVDTPTPAKAGTSPLGAEKELHERNTNN